MSWIHYLIEANLYMVAFYALYVLFLRSETLYQLNRAYLLLTTLLAFVIPFLQLGILKPGVVAPTLQQHISIGEPATGYTMQVLSDPVVAAAVTPKYTLDDYLLFVYAGVAIVLLINLGIRIYLLIALARKGSVTKNASYKVIEMHQGSVAFSFFNNLFIDNRLASSQTILYHEQVHIRQKHSWDIIYLEIVKIINWFNPVVYLIIASIKELHEFIADEQTAVLENSNDDYTDFLISNAYGITQNTLTNSFFNKNLLKRRITMLYQKRSGKAARLKYLLALPLLCGLLCISTLAFTTKTYGLVDVMPKHTDNEVLIKPAVANAEPVYPGGPHALYQFLAAHIDHSKTAEVPDIENHLVLSLVVEKDGTLSDIKVDRDPGGKFSNETINEVKRVLNLEPKWIPGTRNSEPARLKTFVIFGFKDKSTAEVSAGIKQEPKALNTSQSKQNNTDNTLFTAVEHSPEFPGGEQALGNFLGRNIHYPAADRKNKVTGKVYAQFVIGRDGALTDIKIIRTPSKAMGDEATRVLKLSPKWKAGIQNGKKVRVQYTVPINFDLTSNLVKLGPPPPPRSASSHDKPGTTIRTVSITANDTNGPNTVYNAVDVQPEFPGSEAGLAKFLQKNIRYPAVAKQNKVEGKVYVQFVVERDGSLTDIKIVREPGRGIGDEAVRVMKLSPKWNPGVLGGKPVRVQFTLPINFNLGDNEVIEGPPSEKTVDAVPRPPHDYPSDPNNNTVYTAVEIQPEFPGGEAGLAKFLQKTIRYPLEAKKNNIQGKVYIVFVVEKDGSLTDMKIVREPGSGTGDETVRVMKLSPSWLPGVQDGKKVRVQFTIPVNFSLSDASGMLNPIKKSKANDAIASTDVGTAPQFPGGQKVFEKFLAGSVLYPEQDKKNVIEGTVMTQFVIEKDGKLDNIKVTQAPTKAMADEAIRVLTSSPKWTPGQQDGKAVRVAFNVPINFSLTRPRTLPMGIGNVNIGKAADMPDQFYRMADMMVRPQMVYIQVDNGFENKANRPTGWSDQVVYMVEGKIYTRVDLERRSAAISSGNKIATLLHAQTEVYHQPNNKEDIDKYGDIVKNGIFEFKDIVSSKL